MFVSFDLFTFIAWLFLSTFIPGALLSFSIFRKEFNFTEKLLTGFALGFVILPLVPFLLYFFLDIEFSYTIAIASVGLLYLLGFVFFVHSKAYERLLPSEGFKVELSTELAIQAFLALLLIITYLVRIGSYSPIFQELDPYFYTYPATQILVDGYNPPDDQTAWYPEIPENPQEKVSHRLIPPLSYLQATWYALYTGGAGYDNMLLALIASMYPPIAALLAVFFIYLLVSSVTKKEWGLIAAALASFVPVFVYKLAAGEQEVQPYAFFALFFFYSMFVLSLQRKNIRIPSPGDLSFGEDFKYPVLAGLAFAALALGSFSQVLAVTSLILFIVLHSVVLFLREDDGKELHHLILASSMMFIIGPFFFSAIIKPVFESGSPSFTLAIGLLSAIAFSCILYVLKTMEFPFPIVWAYTALIAIPVLLLLAANILSLDSLFATVIGAVPLVFLLAGIFYLVPLYIMKDRRKQARLLGALVLAGLLVYMFTPVGGLIKEQGKAGFETAQFNKPLDRTIAEQGVAATTFSGQIGFIAESFFIPPSMDNIGSFVNLVMFLVMAPFSLIANLLLGLYVAFVNLALDTDVEYNEKAVSFLLFWIFVFWAAVIYSAFRFFRKDENQSHALFMFFLAIVMPPFVVGIIKAKFTIYSGVLLAVAIAYSLGMLAIPLAGLFKEEERRKIAAAALLALGVLFVLFQFTYQGFAPSLLWGSAQTLYQNSPEALAAKFQRFCVAAGDTEVCAAAADPLGYASKGTNYQYNFKLCLLSVYSQYQYIQNPGLAPGWESQSAFFRCQRIGDYWIDSMEWIRDNTEPDSRITSWWDYGHWINYFGQRNAVIRNEHRSPQMIGEVADVYLDATPQELAAWMKAHGSEYALFDLELISGGGSLGGKYGALNYLSCAYNNLTTVSQFPGESQCEADHLWETVFVAGNPCTISPLSGKSGFTAYKIYSGDRYLPYYPDFCINPSDPNTDAYCRNVVRAEPVYCVGNATLVNGQEVFATYYLNETYPNGDLRLNKAVLQLPYQVPTTHLGPATALTLFYTNDPVWIENGEVKSGYEDRKGRFYDSALYRATFLNDLPGFRKVYETPNGAAVKIYKIDE